MAKKYYYLKDDDALEEFRNKNKNKSYVVNRFKGLGEMSVEETEETLLDPEVRIINQVTISDAQKAAKLFDDLMGTAVTPRKTYIKEHSKEATYNAE
jgi:DNA gyrase subunit B